MAVDIETLAGHEAAHAVMRWVLTGVATKTWIDPDIENGKGGMSEGTGKPLHRWTCLMITLAGVVYESGYGLFGSPKWREMVGTFQDVDDAREIINSSPLGFRMIDGALSECKDADECLEIAFKQACEILLQHSELIEHLTEELLKRTVLTAKRVEGICRLYDPGPESR